MNEDFWQSVQEAWQSLSAGDQSHFLAAGVFVATLVAGQAIGWLVGRKLRAIQFDAAFRRPWLPATTADQLGAQTLTPTRVVTELVRLTIWGSGLWWLARQYGWTDLSNGLEWIASRAWSIAVAILGALCLSRLFSAKLVEIMQASPLKQKLDEWLPPPTGARESRVNVAAMAAGFLFDALVILLVLLIAADLLGWTLTGSALAATWQLILHASSAGIALLIGWGGTRWMRTQVTDGATPTSPVARVWHYAGIGVMGSATLLAILLLAGNYATIFGLVLLVLLLLLLWPAQTWLPDIYAGAVLRLQEIKEVQIDGSTYRLGAVGLVQTELSHAEGTEMRRNRVILEAHLANPSSSNGTHSEADPLNGKLHETDKVKESQSTS